MKKCKLCPKETDNIELIANKKNQLIETPICKRCYEKLTIVVKL